MVKLKKSLLKNFLVSVIALVLVLGLINFYSKDVNPDTLVAKKINEFHDSKYDDLELSGSLVNGVREIEVKTFRFGFDPETIIVNKDEKVRFIIESEDIPHGIEIEGFRMGDWDIDEKIRKGVPATIEFDADQTGVWEVICTVYCGGGHGNMKGTFVVR